MDYLLYAPGSLASSKPLPLRPTVTAQRLIVGLVIAIACLVLLTAAPVDNDFWWQDAPRHALNGAFVKDFLTAFPWRDPVGWAAQYYITYPALTIGFYPPLFYLVEAAVFAVFGVSQLAAQLTVILFLFLLGLGAYRLARLLLPRWPALGAALLLIGAPEVARWGRQVMLDIPVHAALIWAMFCVAAYLVRGKPAHLYGAVAFFVAALYLKFSAVFIAVPILAALLVARGPRILLDRHLLLASGMGAAASVPAVLLMLRFGGVNVENATGDFAGDSLASAWLFYLRAIPAQLGIVTAVLAAVGVAWMVARPPAMPRSLLVLFGTWFGFGYVFFSAIHLHEYRHDLIILFPLVLCVAYSVRRWLGARTGEAVILALGVLTFATSVAAGPPATVRGYREITDYVAAHAPPRSVLLYSGYRDGNFVFGMRTHPERDDLRILRTDKLLLRLAVTRDWGVKEAGLGESDILAMMQHDAVGLVVAQRNFWDDLPQMHRFRSVLESGQFRKVASFRVSGDLSTNDGRDVSGGDMVDVYQPTYEVPPPPDSIEIDVPFGRVKLRGTLSGADPK